MDALDDSYQQYDLKVFSDDSSEVFEFVLAELLEPTVFVSRYLVKRSHLKTEHKVIL